MEKLNQKTCEACRADAPPASPAERAELLKQIPQWEIRSVDGIDQLVRLFRFPDFVEALAFTNKVGQLAEAEGHHPALLTEWGSVEVRWWTHKIGGLHVNDFVMAAKTDLLVPQKPEQVGPD